MTTAPLVYLKANGAAVSRITHATVFAAIGTTFGAGDDSTIPNLPDVRSEFIHGWDDSRGVDGGSVLGSNQASQNLLQRHSQHRERSQPPEGAVLPRQLRLSRTL